MDSENNIEDLIESLSNINIKTHKSKSINVDEVFQVKSTGEFNIELINKENESIHLQIINGVQAQFLEGYVFIKNVSSSFKDPFAVIDLYVYDDC